MNVEKIENKSLYHYIDNSRGHLFLFSGASNSGKSHLMRNIVSHQLKKGNPQAGLCFTGSIGNGDYNFLPSQYVVNGYDEEILKKFVAFCEKNPNEYFVIFDDLVGVVKFTSYLINFLTNFRHRGISIYLSTQFITKIPPICRSQASYVFIFKPYTMRSIVATFESFGCKFENVKDFKKFIEEHTKREFTCLVYIQKTDSYIEYLGSKKIENISFKY